MAKKAKNAADARPDGQEELRPDELQQQQAEDLPDREATSLVNANLAIPINAAVAANVLSDGSFAYADAEQDAFMDQST